MSMSLSPSAAVSFVSVLVAVIALILTRLLPTSAPPDHATDVDLLHAIADGQFNWGASTTDVPISTVSVHMKALLSRNVASLPSVLHDLVPSSSSSSSTAGTSSQTSDGDTLSMQPVRQRLHVARLQHIKQLCGPSSSEAGADSGTNSASKHKGRCNFNQRDPEYGLTPLHLAASVNDDALAAYLIAHGADPSVFDRVGRQPRNLSYTHFMRNARAAKPVGEDCDVPIVDFRPSGAGDANDIKAAIRETRRLVSEGEPVLLRGAYSHYASSEKWEVDDFITQFEDVAVRVGAVPYAGGFNLSTADMRLGEYYRRFVRNAEAPNVYVFNKHRGISSPGYHVLLLLLEEAFPMVLKQEKKTDPDNDSMVENGLFIHPNKTGHLDGIHYFFGRKGSGAPFHVHADAVNAAINGDKHWFILTPGRSVYSRKPVRDWMENDLPHLIETDPDNAPLQCVQRAGDVIYIPLDWSHAVHNLHENTFGVALELLNRRDTLAHLTGHA